MDKNNSSLCVIIIFTALLTVIFSYGYAYNREPSEIIIVDNSPEKGDKNYNDNEYINEDFNSDGFFGTMYGEYAK